MGLTIGHRKAGEVASRSGLEAELDDYLQDFGRCADLHAWLMAVLWMEDRKVAVAKGEQGERAGRGCVFLNVLFGDIRLRDDEGLLVGMAAIFQALIDDLNVAVDLMGFPEFVRRGGGLVALHDGNEVLALEFIFSVFRLHVERPEVGEGSGEERVERLVSSGGGKLIEDHTKGLGPGVGLDNLLFVGEAFDILER